MSSTVDLRRSPVCIRQLPYPARRTPHGLTWRQERASKSLVGWLAPPVSLVTSAHVEAHCDTQRTRGPCAGGGQGDAQPHLTSRPLVLLSAPSASAFVTDRQPHNWTKHWSHNGFSMRDCGLQKRVCPPAERAAAGMSRVQNKANHANPKHKGNGCNVFHFCVFLL